jgi:hypothetical protein
VAVDYRAKLLTLMEETLADEAADHSWTYAPIRPEAMPPRPYKRGQHVRADCSKGVQFLCWWARCPNDPMGMHYGPYGNSSTLTLHCHHLDHPHELKIGDLVTFGYLGGDHAAMVKEPGEDPLLWSNGHMGAPNEYRLHYDRRVHQLLHNPIPTYIETPADRLRDKTGFWSWVQWMEGTGSWRHYPPRAKPVRPNVPRVIPPLWWHHWRKIYALRLAANQALAATP